MLKLLIFLLFIPCVRGKRRDLVDFTTLHPLNEGQWRDLEKGEMVAWSKVETANGQQTLDYYGAGIHPRSCTKALRKISQYESYRDFISFITHSRYDEAKREIFLRFAHTLLPYPLTLRFIIPRITAPGNYPFTFTTGMLVGLQGKIQVSPHGHQCLMEISADWGGKPTGINDLVFEIFSVTLGKLGVKKIFRISSL